MSRFVFWSNEMSLIFSSSYHVLSMSSLHVSHLRHVIWSMYDDREFCLNQKTLLTHFRTTTPFINMRIWRFIFDYKSFAKYGYTKSKNILIRYPPNSFQRTYPVRNATSRRTWPIVDFIDQKWIFFIGRIWNRKNETIKLIYFLNNIDEIFADISESLCNFCNNTYIQDLLKSSHLDSLTFYTDTTNLLTWASHWTDSVQLSVIKISWSGRTTTPDHLISRRNCHIGLESDVIHWIWTMYRKYHGAGIRT